MVATIGAWITETTFMIFRQLRSRANPEFIKRYFQLETMFKTSVLHNRMSARFLMEGR